MLAFVAEFLSWIPLALGFVVGVCVAAALLGYQYGVAAVVPPVARIVEDED